MRKLFFVGLIALCTASTSPAAAPAFYMGGGIAGGFIAEVNPHNEHGSWRGTDSTSQCYPLLGLNIESGCRYRFADLRIGFRHAIGWENRRCDGFLSTRLYDYRFLCGLRLYPSSNTNQLVTPFIGGGVTGAWLKRTCNYDAALQYDSPTGFTSQTSGLNWGWLAELGLQFHPGSPVSLLVLLQAERSPIKLAETYDMMSTKYVADFSLQIGLKYALASEHPVGIGD
jgi:hypothetical protein